MPMERYANLGGDSEVVAYEIGTDFIRVEFSGGEIYRYTHECPGIHKVERLKQLAEHGEGLNSFINTEVGSDYAEKE